MFSLVRCEHPCPGDNVELLGTMQMKFAFKISIQLWSRRDSVVPAARNSVVPMAYRRPVFSSTLLKYRTALTWQLWKRRPNSV